MPEMMRALVIVILAASLVGPGLAVADEDKPHLCFSKLDADGDGKVTLAEFQAGYPKLGEAKFRELDKDADNFLDHDEYHDALGHGSLE